MRLHFSGRAPVAFTGLLATCLGVALASVPNAYADGSGTTISSATAPSYGGGGPVPEGQTVQLAGGKVVASDDSSTILVILSATNGELTLTSAAFNSINAGGATIPTGYGADSPAGTIAIQGTADQVNAILNDGVEYQGSTAGADTISIMAAVDPLTTDQQVGDEFAYDPQTHHFYEYVDASQDNKASLTWSQAATDANGLQYGGAQGYLVTEPTAAVAQFLTNDFQAGNSGGAPVWGGAEAFDEPKDDDSQAYGSNGFNGVNPPYSSSAARVWTWADGTAQFSSGPLVFGYHGGPLAGDVMTECSNLAGSCNFIDETNWAGVGGDVDSWVDGADGMWGSGEPDNGGYSPGEDVSASTGSHYLELTDGVWDDVDDTDELAQYVVEFGDINPTATTGTDPASEGFNSGGDDVVAQGSAPLDVEVEAPTITSPGVDPGDLVVSTASPVVRGTGSAGYAVDVYANSGGTTDISYGSPICSTTVASTGSWSCAPTTPLTNHVTYSIDANQTDTSHDSSDPSTAVSFTVDTDTVDAPTISSPADGSVVSTATPTVSGSADAGDTVYVIVDGSEVGTATADSSGAWSFPLTSALSDGDHTVETVAQDKYVKSSAASVPISFTVASGTGGNGTGGNGTGGNGTGGNGTGGNGTTGTGTTGTGTGAAGTVGVPTLGSPVAGAFVSSATPTFSGAGTPGDTVEVFIDGVSVGKATVSGSGSWSLTVPTALAGGSHSVTVSESDSAGETSARSAAVAFTVQAQVPGVPVVVSEPAAATTSTSATFTFNAPAVNTSYRFSLDGGSWSAGGSSYSASNLASGRHSLAVETVSASGLVSSETVYAWTVYPASGPQGLPSSTKTSVGSNITASASHGLAVQVRLNAGSIKQAVVDLYNGGKLIGRGTLNEAKAGHTSANVRVYLNAYGRKLLARAGSKGLSATVESTVAPFSFAALKYKASTKLYLPWAHLAFQVYFANNSAQLSKEAQATIRSAAKRLEGVSDILVAGKTDSNGAPGYNYGLGLRRAKAVVAYLRKLGVDAHLATKSDGENDPGASNATAVGRALNRTATAVVTYYDVPRS